MRWLALLLLVLSVSAQADDALQSCLYLARQAPDKRLTLAKDCPALFAELQSQNVLAASEPSLSAGLSLSQLEFLADSLRQNETGKTISTDGLDPLLASIVDKSQDPKTAEKWWQAFLKWLEGLKSGDYEQEYQWLLRLFSALKPSELTQQILIYGSIALLAAACVALVINELYLAGFFSRLRGRKPPLQPDTQSAADSISTPTTKDFANLPPHKQIALVLEQVIDTLAARQAIPQNKALTHRQILSQLGQNGSQYEMAFAQLVQTAEPIVYGERPLAAEELSQYRLNAQIILDTRPL
jgi:hypothetical protein